MLTGQEVILNSPEETEKIVLVNVCEPGNMSEIVEICNNVASDVEEIMAEGEVDNGEISSIILRNVRE
jgi:hypothetical protein